ncbi:MAG: hypothetical protein IJ033_04825, partial [Clostridia bacterium]|nr:hypothetical protein [Clostridia bacterium]
MGPEGKKKKLIFIICWLSLIAILLVGIILLLPPSEKHETISETMQDSVLHEHNKMSLFGLEVNPGLISAYVVTAI